jgi:hypothetical protein
MANATAEKVSSALVPPFALNLPNQGNSLVVVNDLIYAMPLYEARSGSKPLCSLRLKTVNQCDGLTISNLQTM